LHKYAKPVQEILLLPILSYTKKDAVLASNVEFEVEKKGKTACRTDAMIADQLSREELKDWEGFFQ